jgi:flap endonuclease-1
MIAAFRRCGLEPVPVFDGKSPTEKRSLLEERASLRTSAARRCALLENDLQQVPMSDSQRALVAQEVERLVSSTTYFTGEERELIKQIFYVCGVKPLNASGEADNALAYMAKQGLVAAVVSNDMDLLVRGVEQLWVPESYALPGDLTGWACYSCSEVCKQAALSYTQLVTMCVLMGCDYTHGLLRRQYRAAYALAKRFGTLEEVLCDQGVVDATPYTNAAALFRGELDTPETLMNERQWLKLREPLGTPEWTTLFSLRSTVLRSLSASDFQELCALKRSGFAMDLKPHNCLSGGSHDHPESAH